MVGKTKIMETSYPAASISDNDVSFSNKINSKNKAKENDEKYNDDIGKDPLYAKSRLREWTKNRLYELRQKQRILKHDYILKTTKERKEAQKDRFYTSRSSIYFPFLFLLEGLPERPLLIWLLPPTYFPMDGIQEQGSTVS